MYRPQFVEEFVGALAIRNRSAATNLGWEEIRWDAAGMDIELSMMWVEVREGWEGLPCPQVVGRFVSYGAVIGPEPSKIVRIRHVR